MDVWVNGRFSGSPPSIITWLSIICANATILVNTGNNFRFNTCVELVARMAENGLFCLV